MITETLEELRKKIKNGTIDTVLACIVDMQGRLMGKRFHGQHFVKNAWRETHCCNYLLATDIEMATPGGYKSTSWDKGYGDYIMRPDLSTVRYLPWLEGTALVLCDILDHLTHEEIPFSPRRILKNQIARLNKLGLEPKMATELEFFIFEKGYDELRKDKFRLIEPISHYNEDYHILQTTKEEHIMRPVRNCLFQAGIPIENSKGEAETGQHELNIKYSEALKAADYHTIAKHAIKEISWQKGHAVTFLAKWNTEKAGSSSHLHQSLWKNNKPAFHDDKDILGMSQIMKHYLSGLLKYSYETTFFLAPYVNSYKRFSKNSFAPTSITWSVDNRTAGFRLCGENSKNIRIECRIGGADLNPYLAMASQLAAGISGIEEKLSLQPEAKGNTYHSKTNLIPSTLYAAHKALFSSKMLRKAMGDLVIDHYSRCASWELEEFERVVTDWEIMRGFERV